MRDFVTNEEIIQEARRRCAQGAWDYLVGGAESETTLACADVSSEFAEICWLVFDNSSLALAT